MDQIKLLCDISELNHLFRDSVSVENFLERTVEMVMHHMKTEVCSIYLYDEDTEDLVLKASEGLHRDSVGHIKMKIGDGLTGKALKELRPICVTKASKDPDFKPFIGSGEEDYENFLAVPIMRGVSRIGVLVVQRKKRRKFSEADILACKAVASQLANIIENAKFLMAMHAPVEEKTASEIKSDLNFIKGKVASEGYAFSEAVVVDQEKAFANLMKKKTHTTRTIEDFDRALSQTQVQLEQLQDRVEEKLSDAASLIFASHLLILKDKEFVGAMRKLIEDGANPAKAILQISHQFIDIFAISNHLQVREKVQDVEDLVIRLMANLESEGQPIANYGKRVVIARELFPSDLLRMSSEDVSGIVLVGGGVTSHLSILARSLAIPMVIANNIELMSIPKRVPVLIDADQGNIYVDPSEEVLSGFVEKNKASAAAKLKLTDVKPKTHSADGAQVHLLANINLIGDIKTAHNLKCEGVGLYRTEFPFIIRSDFPSEQEQFATYKKLFDEMKGKPITFRTLDIGGDKVLSYYHDAKEQNPAMGMRSIRFSLQNKGVFTKQIRAILRAGAHSDLRIMFPMISSLEEFIEAREVVRNCSEMLTHEGAEHNSSPKIGMMVELPSVIGLMSTFAEEADFFSIGTNDFIQFMLGVDRTNENVENFYLPYHPSVLGGVSKVIKVAISKGKEVSVCGDMAHDIAYTNFLLGVGLKNFSIEPTYMSKLQKTIEQIDINEAKVFAEQLLAETSLKKIAHLLGIKTEIVS